MRCTPSAPTIRFALSTMLLAAAGACSGTIQGETRPRDGTRGARPDVAPDGTAVEPGATMPPGTPMMPGTTSPPPATAAVPGRLRRLTRAQLEASVRELFGAAATLGPTEEDSTRDGLASVGATYGAISPRGVEQLDGAVQTLLGAVFADPARRSALLGCAPAGVDDAACARSFLAGFGRRAWRRPLTTDELDRYAALATSAGKLLGDAYQGLLHATSALLESPHFIYRVEIGTPDPALGGRFRYSGWEMASRLSYTLWNSTPDDALLDAAAAGRLDDAAGVRAQAERLLASPRARAGMITFGREVVELANLDDAPKNDARMTPTLRAAMTAEVEALFARTLDPATDALDLLDSTATFANAELAGLYGLPGAKAMSSAMTAVQLPPDGPRAGLLGTAAILALYSEQDKTSPTARGVFVREKLLCQPMPQPPDGVNTTLSPANLPLRTKLEMHRTPGCRECHDLFDPIGFTLEGFDWMGAVRDKDAGLPVNTAGQLDDVPLTDARDLARHLRALPDVEQCLVQNLFRYSAGHLETAQDRPALMAWTAAFSSSGRRLATFLADMAASDAFRTVSAAP